MNIKYRALLVLLCCFSIHDASGMSFFRQCASSLGGVFTAASNKISTVVASHPTINSAVNTMSTGLGVCAHGTCRAARACPSLPVIRTVLPWIKANKLFSGCCLALAASAVIFKLYMNACGDGHLINAVRAKNYKRASFLMYWGAQLPDDVQAALRNDLERALLSDDRDYVKLLLDCRVTLQENQKQLLSQVLLDAFIANNFIANNLKRAQFLIKSGITISSTAALPDDDFVNADFPPVRHMDKARRELVQSFHDLDATESSNPAIEFNRRAKAALLIESRVRLNNQTVMQLDGALHSATARGDRVLVGMLLVAGMPVDSANRDGQTALHLAACHGYTGIMADLIKRHADPNAHDREEITPLKYADEFDQIHAGAMLVRKGADLDLAGTIANDHLRNFALEVREERIRQAEDGAAE